MIDISTEKLIPVLAVRDLLPISIPTIRRWTASGKLETVRAGAKVFTSREALMRMLQHGPMQAHQPSLPPTRKQHRQTFEQQRVDAELDEMLGITG